MNEVYGKTSKVPPPPHKAVVGVYVVRDERCVVFVCEHGYVSLLYLKWGCLCREDSVDKLYTQGSRNHQGIKCVMLKHNISDFYYPVYINLHTD